MPRSPRRRPKQSTSERRLFARLRKSGIHVTPSSVGPDTPLPEPLDIQGLSLSDAIIELRQWPPDESGTVSSTAGTGARPAAGMEMGKGPRETKVIPSEQELIRRLAEMGIRAVPGVVDTDEPLRGMVDWKGVTLSDAVIEMRREP